MAGRLNALGIETYIPIRRELRQWSDRKVLKDRILLPRVVFIHTEEAVRTTLFDDVPYISYFMMDRLTRKPVSVPEVQMNVFRRFVDGSPSEVEFRSSDEFAPGDMVRVTSGPLKDIECEVASIKNKTYLCVRLGMLGSVLTEIEASSVERI